MLLVIISKIKTCYFVKSVRIWSSSGPYFPAFGLKRERYRVSLRIQSKCGKIRTTKTPNTDTFHGVCFTKVYFLPMIDQSQTKYC